ncbi:MAG TPA: cation-transporting ATPase, partial [Cyclobacteriaceae bacterium]|nr:cation-transporting ATPase [Cyclobacteriaceae bacterium]
IKKATWDTKTKELVVVYNQEKITEDQIHQLVASAGHDTDKVKAKEEVYANLPFCCLYRDHDHNP